ncbi:HAD-superfamily hydrolase, subfamily IA, variant 3 [Desulforamulus reducens MI-1]|uniref:HAD-superfamily hydrolase, subfamily IA, variant 3 n=1 Tax=Desulforamulus reducens (strain ATCC BAA-1160 / DSM 100696 / MI-1) TaxID=349161 RepID=A4J7A6_DESRM|nr:HAD-IA family hydrolase [Desulforamulus reducens]ABO50959.1 HAD-superfamily hydrolase, subfamily IA, variant 3 [Desulforamulus reducens MI-1]
MIKTILFDLDGTLLDSLPLIKRTYKRVFQEMNIPWANGEVMKCIGLPLVDIGKKFAGEERHAEFFSLYQQHYAIEHDAMTKAYPGTMEMLEDLHQRSLRLGVVTSKSRRVALRSTGFLGIDRYMDVLIGVEDVDRHKPQPDPIFKALEQMQVPAEGAAYIGDSPFDIMSAKAAGVTSIGVSWGMAEGDELLRFEPDYLLNQWSDLLLVLENDTELMD